MSQDRFLFLVTRKLSGEISPGEEAELVVMIGEPAYNRQFQYLRRFWETRESSSQPDIEKALSRTMNQIHEEETKDFEPAIRRKKIVRRFSIAASLLLVLCVATYFMLFPVREKPEALGTTKSRIETETDTVEKQNRKGTRSLITLADGSRVWLNADSKLTYPPSFNGSTREVMLTGEAFFDVAKNRQKPFIIHMENGTVRVLGTSFNIKAYKGDKVIETSVVTGKVAFIPKMQENTPKVDTTFLTRDLKAIYTIQTGIVRTIPTISVEDKAWTEGKMIFKGETMREIARVLERSFGKEVVFDKDEIMNYRLTGSFENNTLEEILYYLSHIKPFTYRITETEVLIFGLD